VFLFEPDIESLNSLVKIDPVVPFETEWNDQDFVYSVRSLESVMTGTDYTLSIIGEILDSDGYPVDLSVVRGIHTPDLVVNVVGTPDSHTYWIEERFEPDLPITFEFAYPMDHESTQAAISLSPSVEVTYEWTGDTELELIPVTFFPEGLEITFTLSPDALGINGETVISNDQTWVGNFGYLDDQISFGEYGANVQLVDMEGYRTIDVGRPLYTGRSDFDLLSVEMVRVTELQFIEFLEYVKENPGAVFDTSGYGVQAAWEVTVDDLGSVFGEAGRWGLIIPEHVPDGLYIMSLTTNHVNDQLAIVASSASVMAKVGEDTNGAGQIVAWVNNINSYMYQEVEIRVFDRNGILLTSGETNEIGVFEGNFNLNYEPYIVVAQKDRMYTLTGIGEDWRYEYNYYDYWTSIWSAPVIETYQVYTYTDRPIYRPGQTVNYKSILRWDYDVEYFVPTTGKEVAVRLRDARGNLVETQPAWLSPFGTIEGSFLINEGSMLGNYTIEVEVDGEIYDQAFKVQEYAKPDYSVSVSTDTESYVTGDTVTVQIDTRYLFGEPVPNADVTLNLYELALSRYLYWWYEEDFDLDDLDTYDWYQTGFNERHGTTDENGLLTVTFSAPIGRYSNGWYVYDYYYYSDSDYTRSYSSKFAVEASVDDGSDQWVSGFSTFDIYSTSAELSLTTAWVAEEGESLTAHVNLRSNFGMEVAGESASLIIEQHRRDSSRYWRNFVDYSETGLVLDETGEAISVLELEEGFYRITVQGQDDRGHNLQSRRYVYVIEENSDFGENFLDGIYLSVDRTDYRVGETAEIMIETPFAGEGLLTIERGGVLDYRVVRVEPPFTLIKVPLYSDYAPNVYVNFQIWEEIDVMQLSSEEYYFYEASVADSKLRSDTVELNVADVVHELNIDISSDREAYLPGDEATFTIKVTNYRGEAVNTEVSLALVDEAIYLLSKELVDPIHEAFFSPRDLGVASYNSLAPVRILRPEGRGGGGGEPGYGEAGANPRSEFPDTLVWYPRLVTGEDGSVRVTVILPDSLTTWRAVVKGVTLDTEVGEAVHTVVTQQPVVVRPQLPKHVIVGDTFDLAAAVHNYSAEKVRFTVSAECSICEFAGETARLVEIGPGASVDVRWPVVVVDDGDGTVVISAESDTLSDAVLAVIEASPDTVVSTTSESGAMVREVSVPVTIPAEALPGSTLTIKLDRSISSTLLDGVEYLTGYPYGCIEQTMSRALPNAVVSRAFVQLGLEDRGGLANLDNKIQASIQRLYAFQHDDGGWGWWYDDSSDAYNTAWVVFGLSVTAESGYYIDPAVIERGTAYLQENLEEMNPATKAFAIYAMSLTGSVQLEDVFVLTSSFGELDTFSQSALVLSLHHLGQEEMAEELLTQILSDLVSDRSGGVHIAGETHDGYYNRKDMSSAVRSNALLLQAVLTVLPEDDSIDGIATWLMSKRRSNLGWGTTNETAFSMISLTDYIVSEQSSNEVIGYTIQMDGVEYLSGEIAAGEASVIEMIPLENLNIGDVNVTIASDSNSRLYYLVGREVISDELPEDVTGVSVERHYTDPESGKELTQFNEGDLVKVTLSVVVHDNVFYVMLEDPLPGGVLALNEGLALTSHEVTANPEERRYYWRTLGYNYKEIYPDQVVFFITKMDSGSYTFEYYVRAVTSGEFVGKPTHLSAMYDETFYGFGEEVVITIQEKVLEE
jgi:uncharacterized protein YfaS (alpha-2-macroglobulin family)